MEAAPIDAFHHGERLSWAEDAGHFSVGRAGAGIIVERLPTHVLSAGITIVTPAIGRSEGRGA
jgi:hypothetical protein